MGRETAADPMVPNRSFDTTPLTEEERAARVASRKNNNALCLLLHDREGITTVMIPPAPTALIVGRKGTSGVNIPLLDDSISRLHASFSVSNECVIVADLGSTNGTWVDGRKVTSHELRAGDEVTLGSVVASIVHLPRGAVAAESYEQLRLRVAEEIERSRFFRNSFVMLTVRCNLAHMPPIRWFPEVQKRLRSIDHMAFHSSGIVQIIMPGAGWPEALVIAAACRDLEIEEQRPLLIGISKFPEAGTNADEIMERSLREALARSPRDPVSSEPTVPWYDAKGETIGPHEERPLALSSSMQELFEATGRLSRATIPILIQGETGVGKEVFARAIHDQGPRRKGPFVQLNCGALPEALAESLLFGHERGAFTGAHQRQVGAFEAAHGGTLLLDEVGDLSLHTQVTLLRILETKRVLRIGATQDVDIDVRVIAATNRDLEAMVEQGSFRRDLYYRLSGIPVMIPPLRERVEEILPLAERFLSQAGRDNPVVATSFSKDAVALFKKYAWPGNVRELHNLVERMAIMSQSTTISEKDLPPRLQAPSRANPSTNTPDAANESNPGLRELVRAYEIDLITRTLQTTGGNQAHAAEILQLPLRTLVYKLRAYNLTKFERTIGAKKSRMR